jgi:hypothetical protein
MGFPTSGSSTRRLIAFEPKASFSWHLFMVIEVANEYLKAKVGESSPYAKWTTEWIRTANGRSLTHISSMPDW